MHCSYDLLWWGHRISLNFWFLTSIIGIGVSIDKGFDVGFVCISSHVMEAESFYPSHYCR